MKQKKGIPTRNLTKPAYNMHVQKVQTPPRVAPRLSSEAKNMRIRNKKNNVSGKK